MRVLLILLWLTSLTACIQSGNGDRSHKESPQIVMNTSYLPGDTVEPPAKDTYDSLIRVHVDTATRKGKREYIMNQFVSDHATVSPDEDTLLDLTYDGNKDYVIKYYGMAGTGIKNRMKVYLFNSICDCYIYNEQLSDLPNPTFYLKEKKITGFYLGHGGGGGAMLEWIKNKWTVTKEFSVDREGDSSKWKISYPLKKKTEVKLQPYQMLPPDNILETNIRE